MKPISADVPNHQAQPDKPRTRSSNTVSRRDFMRLGAAGLGVLGTAGPSWARQAQHVDALVIGTGFGGAVAALRLGQAGISTLVLERGKRWPIRPDGDTFATFENPDGRAAWLSSVTTELTEAPIDVYTGVLELISVPGKNPRATIVSPNLDIRTGAGVGGGSLCYNTILLKPRRELFERVFPGLDFDEMAAYYDRVHGIIGYSVIPADILAKPEYLNYRVIEQQALAAGLTTRPSPLGIDWNVVRQEYAGTRRPSAIAGQSWFGLNSGANLSVDKNYLRMAEETGKVEILPLHVVTDIYEMRERGRTFYLVEANEIDTSGQVLGARKFTCGSLFMAAGSPGTTALLVKAKAKRTLPWLSGQVGKNWGANGEFILVYNDLDRPTNAGTGGPAGHASVEDLQNVDGPISYAGLTVPPPIRPWVPGASFVVGMGIHRPVGTFRYDPATGRVVVDWPRDSTDPRLRRWEQSTINTRNTLFAGNNLQELFFSRGLTGHPLGGATMGTACDEYGRLTGHRGLYVVDGALIPGSSGIVNPALTIAALAERNMEAVIARDLS